MNDDANTTESDDLSSEVTPPIMQLLLQCSLMARSSMVSSQPSSQACHDNVAMPMFPSPDLMRVMSSLVPTTLAVPFLLEGAVQAGYGRFFHSYLTCSAFYAWQEWDYVTLSRILTSLACNPFFCWKELLSRRLCYILAFLPHLQCLFCLKRVVQASIHILAFPSQKPCLW
jgi:hypothetical protein